MGFFVEQVQNDLEFYMSSENGQYLKQNENIAQLQELWKIIKDKE